MNLDQELQSALRRTEAPPEFAARVMSRVHPPKHRWTRTARIAATFLLVSIVGFAAVRHVEQERERRQGEFAKQMLMTAMRITVEKTTVARDAVERASESQ